ncbi:hypothetical protein GCM10010271_72290 [Streptomyces kurssanovii]|nr:hypothetical protein GCM10010271_72290 [Streptomyces kurssanovii]
MGVDRALPVDRQVRPYPERLWQQLEGAIWRFRTGSPWRDMPAEHGAWQTVYHRFQQWRDAGIFEQLMDGMIAEAARRRCRARLKAARLGRSRGGLTSKVLRGRPLPAGWGHETWLSAARRGAVLLEGSRPRIHLGRRRSEASRSDTEGSQSRNGGRLPPHPSESLRSHARAHC